MKAKELKAEQIYYFIIDNSVKPVCFAKAHIEVCADSAFGDLYETREQAEFALKFRNMKREEELSLPFWDKFKKKSTTCFKVNNYSYELFVDKQRDIIVVRKFDGVEWENLFFKLFATYKYYLEACELVKKLWKGE